MFIKLSQDDKPIFINTNRLSSFRPVDGGVYHTELMVDGLSIYVNEDIYKLEELVGRKIKREPYAVSEVKQPYELALEDMQLSVRAYHVLARNKVHNLFDVLKFMNTANLALVRGMGDETKREIVDKLHACGYKLAWEA